MPLAAIKLYQRNLPRLKAESELMLIEAAAFPNLKDAQRKTKIQNLNSLAKGRSRTVTPIKFMPAKGIKVVKVKHGRDE